MHERVLVCDCEEDFFPFWQKKDSCHQEEQGFWVERQRIMIERRWPRSNMKNPCFVNIWMRFSGTDPVVPVFHQVSRVWTINNTLDGADRQQTMKGGRLWTLSWRSCHYSPVSRCLYFSSPPTFFSLCAYWDYGQSQTNTAFYHRSYLNKSQFDYALPLLSLISNFSFDKLDGQKLNTLLVHRIKLMNCETNGSRNWFTVVSIRGKSSTSDLIF